MGTESVGCPKCGSPVLSYLTCHTYPTVLQDGSIRWMSCQPCDSAIEWYCASDECDWSYTQGLNAENPRAEANEAQRPPWVKV